KVMMRSPRIPKWNVKMMRILSMKKDKIKKTVKIPVKTKRGSVIALPAIAILWAFSIMPAVAQSNLKGGNNSFARYLQSKDFKQLEAARKFADEALKTKRDSTNFRTILLRRPAYR